MKSGKFYSRGKFLLSGEYLVMYGAKALAVPLKFGQRMIVGDMPDKGLLKWETYVRDKLWFSAVLDLVDLDIKHSTDEQTVSFIRKLLMAGSELQPALHHSSKGYHIKNFIDFNLDWGLGSSSSLVSNLAYWLEIDPFDLYRNVFQGSGYDVFCSRSEYPITYQLKEGRPVVLKSDFSPAFVDHLYFVYSGRKQDSQASVENFRSRHFDDDKIIREISGLTDEMIEAATLEKFQAVMNHHEKIISAALDLPMVQEELFPDVDGQVKSLGAWGGDFVLAASPMNEKAVRDYFKGKGLDIIFSWKEIIY